MTGRPEAGNTSSGLPAKSAAPDDRPEKALDTAEEATEDTRQGAKGQPKQCPEWIDIQMAPLKPPYVSSTILPGIIIRTTIFSQSSLPSVYNVQLYIEHHCVMPIALIRFFVYQ